MLDIDISHPKNIKRTSNKVMVSYRPATHVTFTGKKEPLGSIDRACFKKKNENGL